MKTKQHRIWVLCIAMFMPLSARADETVSVRIKDERVQEFVNGSLRRTYGNDLVDVATDGKIVAAVTKDGRIQEFKNGSLQRTYGSNAKGVSVNDGHVFADLKDGRTAEYVNGSLKRTY